ncbi:hypothetical protein OWV82_012338 [Melia azedarach]|uniref:Uncharacterized protein n=1 Tax=Melia azedarach TaxID=155640 RepID=A0ACC1Y3F3_MELAZ|nr:hypothetical protein OWV82_012338 [Melia azedarach]
MGNSQGTTTENKSSNTGNEEQRKLSQPPGGRVRRNGKKKENNMAMGKDNIPGLEDDSSPPENESSISNEQKK